MTDKAVNRSSEKILVIGCPGTGKSTFSKQLGNILNIEVIHLDKYFWKSGWIESSKEEWKETVSKLISKDQWIIDGNYSNTIRLRAEQADEILFFDYSAVFCTYRIFKRIFKTKFKLEIRDDLAEGCPEKWFDSKFIKFTWNFNKKIRPLTFRILEELNFREKRLTIFKNANEATYYLNSLNLK